ncbi:RNA 2',3'-cyclic phosphodiesterase [Paenibacillus sp. J5C_2022]|uniref:RNA 2',3'-cyclic phosphodiesterase n=1 Tax=Paenibacillus sp. J5C2022 TaxID=2977129 RepID=UPI0021D2BADE|nr:RNA 2',3'-cyclic phosphodiesterase [Paenibacillus sp. J5C2022]MCU6707504.1 RNA 2',3'-cyclic phosphodiesterase [Paenibacillus sp. J5C2022]
MRLFTALPLPASIAEELHLWTQLFRDTLHFRKWTHWRDYHLTLQFLGETPPDKAEQLQAALQGITASPIELSLHGAGTFGPATAPRVLWAAVSGETDALTALHKAVVRTTQPLGFASEDRPYAAHITLARRYAGADGSFNREALRAIPAGTKWTADRFVLMRTHMDKSPMYETIGEYPLRNLE